MGHAWCQGEDSLSTEADSFFHIVRGLVVSIHQLNDFSYNNLSIFINYNHVCTSRLQCVNILHPLHSKLQILRQTQISKTFFKGKVQLDQNEVLCTCQQIRLWQVLDDDRIIQLFSMDHLYEGRYLPTPQSQNKKVLLTCRNQCHDNTTKHNNRILFIQKTSLNEIGVYPREK